MLQCLKWVEISKGLQMDGSVDRGFEEVEVGILRISSQEDGRVAETKGMEVFYLSLSGKGVLFRTRLGLPERLVLYLICLLLCNKGRGKSRPYSLAALAGHIICLLLFYAEQHLCKMYRPWPLMIFARLGARNVLEEQPQWQTVTDTRAFSPVRNSSPRSNIPDVHLHKILNRCPLLQAFAGLVNTSGYRCALKSMEIWLDLRHGMLSSIGSQLRECENGPHICARCPEMERWLLEVSSTSKRFQLLIIRTLKMPIRLSIITVPVSTPLFCYTYCLQPFATYPEYMLPTS